MKIRTKNTLFTSFFLILVVAVITWIGIQNIRQQGNERIENFRAEELAKVKVHLKDLVDVAYETIDQNHRNLSDLDFLSQYYREKLDNILNTGESIINKYKQQHAQGAISLEQAKTRAMEDIKALRFDGGTGYIWINDTGKPYPTMIMHPTVPELDGQELKDPKFNNAQGVNKNLFVAFVEVTEQGQDGYVDYLWPKPTENGLTEQQAKLSYVRRYADWDWILGTGIYIDDAEEDISNLIKNSVKAMRYADGTGYFWINDNSQPFPIMVMHPTIPELDGQVLNDPKYNNAQGVDKNLFVAFNEVTAENGEGFVDYLWPKPTPNGLTERTEKMSYVRLHEPTGWIIGSGAYIDNIDASVVAKQAEIDRQINDLMISNLLVSGLFVVLAVMASWVFSNRTTQPIRNLTQVANEISHGNNLSQTISEIDRNDEIGELAKSIDRLKTSVKIMIDRMKR